ncbi:hypothetical protein AMTR_s00008p00209470 [Amborella trichopoda]|uniref:Uncharacterized protein n=1 Tax=Amborella trichopoda TaxID=13333 RepID=W1NJM6_AMBTC|nr:hypothetical protein AMTR_s00008p00209470 [Amborella trichopoda]
MWLLYNLSESDAIGNGIDNISIAFRCVFGHMSCFGDSELVQMDQSQLQAISTNAGGIWAVVRYQLAHHFDVSRPDNTLNGIGNIGITARLLGILKLKKGGHGLGAIWTGADTRHLVFRVACVMTEVTSVSCHRTFSRSLVPIEMAYLGHFNISITSLAEIGVFRVAPLCRMCLTLAARQEVAKKWTLAVKELSGRENLDSSSIESWPHERGICHV